MAKGILDRLADGVVLGDGGYIVELEQRGYVVTGAFTPELAITHPEAIAELHREMRNAGSEVLQVMAFYGSREQLATVGYGDRTVEINQAGTRLAREVAGDELLVAGDLTRPGSGSRMMPTLSGSLRTCSTNRSRLSQASISSLESSSSAWARRCFASTG